jgi:NAD(P)-dependent dehydrogenase (short-subunit alcohol dehydrogenase family)
METGMKAKIKGSVVLVTGASRGIGRAIAHAFAREGAKLVIAARSIEALRKVEGELSTLGAEVLAVPCDVRDDAAVASLVEAATERFGRIDVLVNNAGIGRVSAVVEPAFIDDVKDTLQASLFGMIRMTQAVLPLFRAQGSGAIVNMSSVMGRKAFARFGSYAIVMHAVSALSDALRQECAGSGITVSVIHPALTATDLLREVNEADMPLPFRHMTPLTSEEIGRATVRAVAKGRQRVVLPRMANMLLLGEALSPRIGNLIAFALTVKPIAWGLGMSRGRTYHQTIGATPQQKGAY